MSDILETLNSEDGQWRVEVWPDYDCSSPREDGVNLGTMLTWDRDYNSPDENEFSDPDVFEEFWNGVYNDGSSRLEDGEVAPKDDPRYVRLPVIKYEHSGVAYSTGRAYPFNDRWDSCQVGWIFSTPKSLEETGAPLESVADQLKAEVDYYSKWASGQCYGYSVGKKTSHCDNPDHDNFDTVDSCGGFIVTIGAGNFETEEMPADLVTQINESYYFKEEK